MKNLKSRFEEHRKKYYEKNSLVLHHYENLTREELIIDYANKKSSYEYQRNFLIGTIITVFLLWLSGSQTIHLFFKTSLGVEGKIKNAMEIFQFLEMGILVVLFISVMIFMFFSLKDIQKAQKDLFIMEEIKKTREKNL